MLQIFNTSGLSQKQRFLQALVAGALASIVFIFAYFLISKLMYSIGIEFAYAYIAIGYGIGWVIKKTGHGVQMKFSVLAAVLCVIVIIIGDMVTVFPMELIFSDFLFCLQTVIRFYFSLDFIISLVFRILGVAMAFGNARVL